MATTSAPRMRALPTRAEEVSIVTESLTLPTRERIDEADDKIGSVLSDVDWWKSLAEKVEQGNVLSLADYQMERHRIALDDGPEFTLEPQSFLHLLVFAADLQRDADTLKADAAEIEQRLLAIYHNEVTDGQPRKIEADEEDDEAE